MIKNVTQLRKELEDYSNKDSKIARLVKNGELIRLNRGIYETDSTAPRMALGPFIYGPSYISFESALAFYGLIPEYVPNCLCATSKKYTHKIITNHFGIFIYKSIPEASFTAGVSRTFEREYTYPIATPEKAVCDMLYDHAPIQNDDIRGFLFDGMRIDDEEFAKLNKDGMLELAPLYKAHNLNLLENWLRV